MVTSVLALILIATLAVGNAHQSDCSSVGDSKPATKAHQDQCSNTPCCKPVSMADVHQSPSSSVEVSNVDGDNEEGSSNIFEEQDSSSNDLPPNRDLRNYRSSEITDGSSGYEQSNKDKADSDKPFAWYEPFLPQWKNIISSLQVMGDSHARDYGTHGRSILHFLVSQDNAEPEIFQQLLKFQVDVNAADSYGQTPLHLAVFMNKPQIVKLLLDNGADAQYRNKEGSTALHLALFLKYDDICTLLLQHEQSVEQPGELYNSDDEDAVHLAIHTEVPESIFHQLLESGKGRNSLKQSDYGWRDVKVAFWRYPSNIDYENTANAKAQAAGIVLTNVGPLIHHAIYKCRKQYLEELVKAGADPDLKDRDGATPLHLAVEYCPDVVDDLIIAAVSINEQNNFHQTALHLAAKKGDEDLIKKLIDAGASLLAKDKQEQTPVAYAEDADRFESANLLKDAIAGEAALELSKDCPTIVASEEEPVDQNAIGDEQVLTIEAPTEIQAESGEDYTSAGYLSNSRACSSVALIFSCIIVPLLISL